MPPGSSAIGWKMIRKLRLLLMTATAPAALPPLGLLLKMATLEI